VHELSIGRFLVLKKAENVTQCFLLRLIFEMSTINQGNSTSRQCQLPVLHSTFSRHPNQGLGQLKNLVTLLGIKPSGMS
jgi:hypothetical protein